MATVDEQAEYISIAAASKLLAVHRNTIRNRIKTLLFANLESPGRSCKGRRELRGQS